MVLQGLASDNRLCVPAAYPLQPFDQGKAAWEIRPAPYSSRSKVKGLLAPNKALAPIIDAMLLKGGMTMRGIVRELRRKASAACRGKDLKANVRARLYWLRKRGHRIRWNGQERVQAAPTPAARSASRLTGS
ncbi:MAG: hypothetical protein HY549_13100 [Elusimicrobia bacterium]|nr:hypothetical protein [Elusimicrobiota bacterium]